MSVCLCVTNLTIISAWTMIWTFKCLQSVDQGSETDLIIQTFKCQSQARVSMRRFRHQGSHVVILVTFKEMKSFTPVQTIMKHGLRDKQVNLTIWCSVVLLFIIKNSDQKVTCIWHRQSDSMMWWPQNLKECNRE